MRLKIAQHVKLMAQVVFLALLLSMFTIQHRTDANSNVRYKIVNCANLLIRNVVNAKLDTFYSSKQGNVFRPVLSIVFWLLNAVRLFNAGNAKTSIS